MEDDGAVKWASYDSWGGDMAPPASHDPWGGERGTPGFPDAVLQDDHASLPAGHWDNWGEWSGDSTGPSSPAQWQVDSLTSSATSFHMQASRGVPAPTANVGDWPLEGDGLAKSMLLAHSTETPQEGLAKATSKAAPGVPTPPRPVYGTLAASTGHDEGSYAEELMTASAYGVNVPPRAVGKAPPVQCWTSSPAIDGPNAPQTSGEWRKLITDVYTRHNPQKLAELPEILSKYSGCEGQLYDALASKYHLPLRSTTGDSAKSENSRSAVVPPPVARGATTAKSPAKATPSGWPGDSRFDDSGTGGFGNGGWPSEAHDAAQGWNAENWQNAWGGTEWKDKPNAAESWVANQEPEPDNDEDREAVVAPPPPNYGGIQGFRGLAEPSAVTKPKSTPMQPSISRVEAYGAKAGAVSLVTSKGAWGASFAATAAAESDDESGPPPPGYASRGATDRSWTGSHPPVVSESVYARSPIADSPAPHTGTSGNSWEPTSWTAGSGNWQASGGYGDQGNYSAYGHPNIPKYENSNSWSCAANGSGPTVAVLQAVKEEAHEDAQASAALSEKAPPPERPSSLQATLPGMPPAVMPGPQLHARRPPSDPGLVSALQSLQTMFPPGAAQNDPNTVARAAAQLLGQNGLAALQNMMGGLQGGSIQHLLANAQTGQTAQTQAQAQAQAHAHARVQAQLQGQAQAQQLALSQQMAAQQALVQQQAMSPQQQAMAQQAALVAAAQQAAAQQQVRAQPQASVQPKVQDRESERRSNLEAEAKRITEEMRRGEASSRQLAEEKRQSEEEKKRRTDEALRQAEIVRRRIEEKQKLEAAAEEAKAAASAPAPEEAKPAVARPNAAESEKPLVDPQTAPAPESTERRSATEAETTQLRHTEESKRTAAAEAVPVVAVTPSAESQRAEEPKMEAAARATVFDQVADSVKMEPSDEPPKKQRRLASPVKEVRTTTEPPVRKDEVRKEPVSRVSVFDQVAEPVRHTASEGPSLKQRRLAVRDSGEWWGLKSLWEIPKPPKEGVPLGRFRLRVFEGTEELSSIEVNYSCIIFGSSLHHAHVADTSESVKGQHAALIFQPPDSFCLEAINGECLLTSPDGAEKPLRVIVGGKREPLNARLCCFTLSKSKLVFVLDTQPAPASESQQQEEKERKISRSRQRHEDMPQAQRAPQPLQPPSPVMTARRKDVEQPERVERRAVREEVKERPREPKERHEAKERSKEDGQEVRAPKEHKRPKEKKELKERREHLEPNESKEPKELKEAKERPKEDGKEGRAPQEHKKPKEHKRPKEKKELKERREHQEPNEPKEPKELKEAKDRTRVETKQRSRHEVKEKTQHKEKERRQEEKLREPLREEKRDEKRQLEEPPPAKGTRPKQAAKRRRSPSLSAERRTGKHQRSESPQVPSKKDKTRHAEERRRSPVRQGRRRCPSSSSSPPKARKAVSRKKREPSCSSSRGSVSLAGHA